MPTSLQTAPPVLAQPRDILPGLASYASSVLPGAPDRRAQFAAGRGCAAAALAGLGCFVGPDRIVRGRRGQPVWPRGYCGSITHSGSYVAAAAARLTEIAGIGIDSVEIVAAERAARVATVIARPEELQRLRRAGMDAGTALTVVFSAKESLFKCLFPLVQRYFDFLDAEVSGVDVEQARLAFAVSPALTERVRATAVSARFMIAGEFVHTGVWLMPE